MLQDDIQKNKTKRGVSNAHTSSVINYDYFLKKVDLTWPS